VRRRRDPCCAHLAAWLAFRGRQLQPLPGEAARFLRALDPQAKGFSFRTFSDTPYTRRPDGDPLEWALHGPLEACWPRLLELNRQGAAICVTINATACRGSWFAPGSHGRGPADIRRVRALFIDDDRPPVSSRGRFALTPQIQVVSSAGRYHHYWLVRELPLGRFSRLQQRLAERFGADHRVAALNQAMQLPGLWRRKQPQRPVLPRLRRITAIPPYDEREIERLLAGG